MATTRQFEGTTTVKYRFGLVHAERKDLDTHSLEPPEDVDVKIDFDVRAPFDLEAAETDITIERDMWDSDIAVRVKGIFHFNQPFCSVESAEEFVRTVALTRTLHVCLAEVDRLARELDVSVLAVPIGIEEGLQNVKLEFVGAVSYEDYDPSSPPIIEPVREELGEDRSSVERTHSWDEVASDFAQYFGVDARTLLRRIQNELEMVGEENVVTVIGEPTDTEACEFMHRLFNK